VLYPSGPVLDTPDVRSAEVNACLSAVAGAPGNPRTRSRSRTQRWWRKLIDRWDARWPFWWSEGSRMSQQSRRHDPYPWTWEFPFGFVLVILMVLICGVHLERGIANVVAGAGWAFPTHVQLFRSACRLRGDAAALMASTGLCHRRQRCGRGSSQRR
jgi:hypothetical protein